MATLFSWQLKGARTLYVGEVEATNEQEAVEKAADKFEVLPAHRNRLIARPSDF